MIRKVWRDEHVRGMKDEVKSPASYEIFTWKEEKETIEENGT